MIRNPTPGNISLFTSFILALLVSGVVYVVNPEISDVLISFGVVLVSSFILFFLAIEIFIYRKIKLIYKTIHRLKTQRHLSDALRETSLRHNPIDEVNDEVLAWAKSQATEIEQLRKLETFRKEFLGNVSHELKTPIFNIQGYIHTLLDGAIDDPDVNIRFLKKAAKSLDRLSDLVEDLISISQLETGQMKMEMEKFDIHALCVDIYESMEMRANEKGIELTFKEGCDKPFWVLADKYRIRQVMVNLIVNSIKYGKQDGVTLVSFYDMDENLLIEVADNGEGIEAMHLARLFERFYRVDRHRSRDEGGSGLGLAIVKHIIEAHNQTINVRSKIGVGTTFGFTLRKAGAEKVAVVL
jgi:two-component system, OmpR family, phosphate regulon sensor histidine kinase PhoR